MAQQSRDAEWNQLFADLRDVLSRAGVARAEVIRIPQSTEPKPKPKLPVEVQELVPEAKKIRTDYRIPYWEAVMLLAEVRGVSLPPEMLAATGFHRSREHYISWSVDVSDSFSMQMDGLMAQLSDSDVAALSSRVTSHTGTVGHIPMVDLRIRHSSTATATAVEVFRTLGVSGTLFQTENSYHFYGEEVLSQDEFITFLARTALFSPVVDQRWIAHQLIDRHCALRVSESPTGSIPAKYCHIGAETGTSTEHV